MSVLCNAIAARFVFFVVGILIGGSPARTLPANASAPSVVTVAVSVERDTAVAAPQPPKPAEPKTPSRPKKPAKPEKSVKITINDEGIKIGNEGSEKVTIEVDSEKLSNQIKKSLEGLPESLAAAFGADEDKRYGILRSSDVVQFGKRIGIATNELVNGDVVNFFADVDVDGKVMGDVAAIFGDVRIGPQAVVNGQVVSILGDVTKEPGAVVRGETAVVGKSYHGRTGPGLVWSWGPPLGKGLFGAGARVVLLIILALLMLLILYFISGRLERAAQYLSASFFKSLGIGVLVLFPGTLFAIVLTIILAITIVGIPVAVLLMLSLFALFVLGYFTSALELGKLVARKLNTETDSPYVHGILGLFLLAILGIIAAIMYLNPFFGPARLALRILGGLFNLVAVTVGVGAFISSKAGSRPAGPQAPPAERLDR